MMGLVFAILNSQTVQLNYYFGSKELHFSLALIVAMLVGALLGVAVSLSMLLRLRREAARLRKAVEMAEKEMANLRINPIKTLY
jgi:putative membrane protein